MQRPYTPFETLEWPIWTSASRRRLMMAVFGIEPRALAKVPPRRHHAYVQVSEGWLTADDADNLRRITTEQLFAQIIIAASARQRTVMVYRLGLDGESPRSMAAVGSQLGISTATSSSLWYSGLKRLRRECDTVRQRF